jgi:hypothetical protein
MQVIVGAIVIGPMKRRRKPIKPVKPMIIWIKEATIIAPWILKNVKLLSLKTA